MDFQHNNDATRAPWETYFLLTIIHGKKFEFPYSLQTLNEIFMDCREAFITASLKII